MSAKKKYFENLSGNAASDGIKMTNTSQIHLRFLAMSKYKSRLGFFLEYLYPYQK